MIEVGVVIVVVVFAATADTVIPLFWFLPATMQVIDCFELLFFFLDSFRHFCQNIKIFQI